MAIKTHLRPWVSCYEKLWVALEHATLSTTIRTRLYRPLSTLHFDLDIRTLDQSMAFSWLLLPCRCSSTPNITHQRSVKVLLRTKNIGLFTARNLLMKKKILSQVCWTQSIDLPATQSADVKHNNNGANPAWLKIIIVKVDQFNSPLRQKCHHYQPSL